MNKRIKTISKYIDETDLVLDIGCDQALLAEILAKKKINSIASDIKANIVESARNRMKKLEIDKFVKFIVSDGLKNINEDVDTLVLSGMGTHTILEILKCAKKMYKKIITISNNNHDILRKNMLKLGYKISIEEIIIEKNKYYNLIIFVPGICKYSKEEVIVGKNHQNKELLIQKLSKELSKYKINYQKGNTSLKEKISVIEKKLECH